MDGNIIAAIITTVTSDQMIGMDSGPGTDPGGLGFFIGVWVRERPRGPTWRRMATPPPTKTSNGQFGKLAASAMLPS